MRVYGPCTHAEGRTLGFAHSLCLMYCQTRCLGSQSASSIMSEGSTAPPATSNSAKEATPLFDATTGTAQSLSELFKTVGEAAAAFTEYVDDTLEFTLRMKTGTCSEPAESKSNSSGGTDTQDEVVRLNAYSNESNVSNVSNVSSPSFRGSGNTAIATAYSTDNHAVILPRCHTSNSMTTPGLVTSNTARNDRRPRRLDHSPGSAIPFGNDDNDATPSNRGGYGTFGSTTTGTTLPGRMFAQADGWERVQQQRTTLQEKIIALRRKNATLELAFPVAVTILLLAYLFSLAWVSP
jgi:hypothetical protein